MNKHEPYMHIFGIVHTGGMHRPIPSLLLAHEQPMACYLYLYFTSFYLNIHDFLECLAEFRIKYGINNWIHKAVHVAEPRC